MRTITETLHKRLVAQSEEAKIQGLTKTASHIDEKIATTKVRKNESIYVYSNEDFQKDVESALWDAVLRVADFHNTTFDANEVQNIIDKYSQELVSDLRVLANVEHGVGAFEPTIPGETKAQVILSLEDDEE